jgi:hypothetical protein
MQQQNQQPIPDLSTLSFRITSLEQHVQQLQLELRTYVPARENELQLQSIRSTVERIESDVKAVKQQATELANKQDSILISVLRYVVVTIVGVIAAVATGLIIYFITHPGG